MNPGLQLYMEKLGFWPLEAGKTILKGMGRAVTVPGRAVGHLGMEAAGGVAGMARHAVEREGLGAVGTLGLGIPLTLGFGVSNPFKNPETMARAAESQGRVAAAVPEAAMKLSSSVLSQSDFDAGNRIRRELEKTAGRKPVAFAAEELAEMAGKAFRSPRKAARAVQPKSSGMLGNIMKEIIGEAPHSEHVHDPAEEIAALKRQLSESGKRPRSNRIAELTKMVPEVGSDTQRVAKGSHDADMLRLNEEKGVREASRLQIETPKLQAETEKLRNKMTPMKAVLTALGLGAAGTAIGAGTQLASTGIAKAHEHARAATADKRYQSMVRVDPTLGEHPHARTYFNILDRASPYIAGEPYLAAATVQQMVSTPSLTERGVPAIQPKMLQEILKTEESRHATRHHLTADRANDIKNLASAYKG